MTEDLQPVRVATLTWGVKQSFRNYVEGAGGAIGTGEGVGRATDGAFTFAAAHGPGLILGADGRPEGSGTFPGEVHFEAHGGMLSVRLVDPALEVSEAGAVITVFDRDRRITLADLDLAAVTLDDEGERIIPAKLARDGWQVLGDHYPPGTPLDPVRLRVDAG